MCLLTFFTIDTPTNVGCWRQYFIYTRTYIFLTAEQILSVISEDQNYSI